MLLMKPKNEGKFVYLSQSSREKNQKTAFKNESHRKKIVKQKKNGKHPGTRMMTFIWKTWVNDQINSTGSTKPKFIQF